VTQRFLDRGQLVGYDFTDGKKALIVTMSEKIALKMRADGWNVQEDETLGWFITISKGDSS
jgi:hypothetical protein